MAVLIWPAASADVLAQAAAVIAFLHGKEAAHCVKLFLQRAALRLHIQHQVHAVQLLLGDALLQGF